MKLNFPFPFVSVPTAALAAALTFGSPIQKTAAQAEQSGFAVPPENYPFKFPRDHGSHPDYRIEWWYITGHLNTAGPDGRPSDTPSFGYQATFFRIGQRPGIHPEKSLVTGDHIFMAHMALTDIHNGKFHHEEKLNRRGWDAWALESHLDTRNGNWTLVQDPDFTEFRAGLKSTIGADIRFDLQLTSENPPVIFGDNGVSIKGDAPSARSLYITFPRLNTTGSITIGREKLTVTGISWMDHEISSSQLDDNQVGWNWASILLDDGRAIMVYMMRQTDQSKSPWSSFNLIEMGQSAATHYPAAVFDWVPDRWWTSPLSENSYPVASTIRLNFSGDGIDSLHRPAPSLPESLRLVPRLDGQEMLSLISGVEYWEGACEVLNPKGKRIGQAYVELTGYGTALTPLLNDTSP